LIPDILGALKQRRADEGLFDRFITTVSADHKVKCERLIVTHH
jgi:hypothetical protein